MVKRRSQNSKTSPEKVRVDSRIVRIAADSNELEEIKTLMLGAVRLRELYAQVLTKEVERVTISVSGEEHLDSPNYAATIADRLGFIRGLRHAINLLAPTGANLGADHAR